MAEPAITLRAVHDSGAPNAPVTRIVIHATAGGQGFPAESAAGVAHATARYFQSQAAGGSAHYICDVAAEEHCVPDGVVAWHAPPNPGSIGIEVCADPTYTRAQWLDPKVWPAVVRAAARCRELCDRFGVPKVKLTSAGLLAGAHGVCGHVDVSGAWHQSDHWDPGPNFPWDRFMALVADQTPPPTAEDPDMLLIRKKSTGLVCLIVGTRNVPVSGGTGDYEALQGAGIPVVNLSDVQFDRLVAATNGA